MQRRLLLDKDSQAARLVLLLEAAGWEVVTASNAGLDECTDEQILIAATARQLTVYTANVRDFVRLHRAWAERGDVHAGIIVRSPQWASPEIQLAALLGLDATGPDDWTLLLAFVRSQAVPLP